MLKAAGAIDDEELLTFRKLGSRLEGHPTPRIPPTDVATGSLGQGLPIARRRRDGRQAARPAALPRLVPVRRLRDGRGLDVGGLRARRLGGPRQPDRDHRRQPPRPDARDDARLGPRRLRARASRPSAGTRSRSTATTSTRSRPPTPRPRRPTGKPTAIIAQTKKGKGVKAVEDQPGKHGKPLDDPEAAIEELGGERDLQRRGRQARGRRAARLRDARRRAADLGPRRGGRDAQGLRRGRSPRSARSAATSSRSTARSRTRRTPRTFREAHPDRYFEMFIAEQQMVAAAVGMQVRGWMPFASTFAAFLSRAYDFVRMAAISRANLRARRARTPASRSARTARRRWRSRTSRRSARSTARPCCTRPTPTRRRSSIAAMADRKGISFLRTLRGKTAGPHAAGRGRPHRRQPRRARGRRRRDRRLRHHASTRRSRPPSGSRATASTPACIDCLLDQADRRRGRPRRRARLRRDRHRRGPLARGRPRRRGARGARRRPTTARRSSSSPSARCPARARRRSCCTRAGIDAEAIADAARTVVGARA